MSLRINHSVKQTTRIKHWKKTWGFYRKWLMQKDDRYIIPPGDTHISCTEDHEKCSLHKELNECSLLSDTFHLSLRRTGVGGCHTASLHTPWPLQGLLHCAVVFPKAYVGITWAGLISTFCGVGWVSAFQATPVSSGHFSWLWDSNLVGLKGRPADLHLGKWFKQFWSGKFGQHRTHNRLRLENVSCRKRIHSLSKGSPLRGGLLGSPILSAPCRHFCSAAITGHRACGLQARSWPEVVYVSAGFSSLARPE